MDLFIFPIGFVCLGLSFFCFDYLLKIQFKNHSELWVEDGEPTFIWGRPKGFFDLSFSSQIAGFAKSLSLFFGNPDWISQSKRLKRVAFIYRTGVIVFWIIWLIQMTRIFNE